MLNEIALRARAVEVATSLVGLATLEKWARLLNLAPPALADTSAFVVSGVWRSLGIAPERLGSRMSVFSLAEIAMDCGAWRCRPKDYIPLPGDTAVLGDGSLEGAHAYLVTQVRPGSPLLLRSVEGSLGSVKSQIREWDGMLDRTSGRSVLGWIDVTALPIASRIEG